MAKAISIQLDDAVYEKLKAAAMGERRSIAGYLRIMVEDNIKALEAAGAVLVVESPTPPKRDTLRKAKA